MRLPKLFSYTIEPRTLYLGQSTKKSWMVTIISHQTINLLICLPLITFKKKPTTIPVFFIQKHSHVRQLHRLWMQAMHYVFAEFLKSLPVSLFLEDQKQLAGSLVDFQSWDKLRKLWSIILGGFFIRKVLIKLISEMETYVILDDVAS